MTKASFAAINLAVEDARVRYPPGVERSIAGRFSFLPSYSRVFYAFRVSPAQTAALSVCREIFVSRTQPSRLHPPVRKIGPELSGSLFSGAGRVNTEFSFGVRMRTHSNKTPPTVTDELSDPR